MASVLLHFGHKDSSGRIIDAANKILFRDNFQKAMLQSIEDYRAELLQNNDYQAAFIRKFDDLINE